MADLLDLFRALADPTRLRIVALLQTMELAIGELAVVLDQSQPRVSRHVRILADAGIVDRHREGSWVFLRISSHADLAQLIDTLRQWPLSPTEQRVIDRDRQRLQAVRDERTTAANRYFDDHASEWDRIRSRHVAEADVESAMLRMMHNRRLGHLLDIGTGTGRMAAIFAPTARRVTALDRNPEMLRIARAKLAEHTITVNLVQGDGMALPLDAAAVDTVVMHQVLHFAHEPERMIAEAARVLRGGGHLLIADFASHDQEDLRSKSAHVRLGFSDAQIRGWFASNAMLIEATQTLEGGQKPDGEALTVKLWLGRRRSNDDPISLSGDEETNRKRTAA